jgi:uncharacterized protein (TIGR02284 family)
MATLVGTQKDLVTALDALLELDYDAIEAYRAAIDRVRDPSDKAQLTAFMADHHRHTRELAPFVAQLGGSPSVGPDFKQWLTKGKVAIMALVGEDAVLFAMRTNEEDTNTAYERILQRRDLPFDIRIVLSNNYVDELRHKAWLEARLAARSVATAGE